MSTTITGNPRHRTGGLSASTVNIPFTSLDGAKAWIGDKSETYAIVPMSRTFYHVMTHENAERLAGDQSPCDTPAQEFDVNFCVTVSKRRTA